MSREKLFLFKRNNVDIESENRYVVEYLEPMNFECNHYFGGGDITGATHSNRLKLEEIDFDNITTILTKEDFEYLVKKQQELKDLGYALDEEKNQDKKVKGFEILEELNVIYDKLRSKENQELFDTVIQEEKDYVAKSFNLDMVIVDEIFNAYRDTDEYAYQDRTIISTIFHNMSEIGEELIVNGVFNCSSELQDFIDYDRLGQYAVDNSDSYYELSNGDIVWFAL